jgi:hypothetical protein
LDDSEGRAMKKCRRFGTAFHGKCKQHKTLNRQITAKIHESSEISKVEEK